MASHSIPQTTKTKQNKMISKLLSLKTAVIAIVAIVSIAFIKKSVFYADQGYIYHVRTVTGAERVVL